MRVAVPPGSLSNFICNSGSLFWLPMVPIMLKFGSLFLSLQCRLKSTMRAAVPPGSLSVRSSVGCAAPTALSPMILHSMWILAFDVIAIVSVLLRSLQLEWELLSWRSLYNNVPMCHNGNVEMCLQSTLYKSEHIFHDRRRLGSKPRVDELLSFHALNPWHWKT